MHVAPTTCIPHPHPSASASGWCLWSSLPLWTGIRFRGPSRRQSASTGCRRPTGPFLNRCTALPRTKQDRAHATPPHFGVNYRQPAQSSTKTPPLPPPRRPRRTTCTLASYWRSRRAHKVESSARGVAARSLGPGSCKLWCRCTHVIPMSRTKLGPQH